MNQEKNPEMYKKYFTKIIKIKIQEFLVLNKNKNIRKIMISKKYVRNKHFLPSCESEIASSCLRDFNPLPNIVQSNKTSAAK